MDAMNNELTKTIIYLFYGSFDIRASAKYNDWHMFQLDFKRESEGK